MLGLQGVANAFSRGRQNSRLSSGFPKSTLSKGLPFNRLNAASGQGVFLGTRPLEMAILSKNGVMHKKRGQAPQTEPVPVFYPFFMTARNGLGLKFFPEQRRTAPQTEPVPVVPELPNISLDHTLIDCPP
jgi:hypothetical protein